MDSEMRTEAQKLAAQVICCVIDQDQLGLNTLLGDCRPEIVGQALIDLARWVVSGVDDEDKGEFRAGIAGQLLRQAEEDGG